MMMATVIFIPSHNAFAGYKSNCLLGLAASAMLMATTGNLKITFQQNSMLGAIAGSVVASIGGYKLIRLIDPSRRLFTALLKSASRGEDGWYCFVTKNEAEEQFLESFLERSSCNEWGLKDQVIKADNGGIKMTKMAVDYFNGINGLSAMGIATTVLLPLLGLCLGPAITTRGGFFALPEIRCGL